MVRMGVLAEATEPTVTRPFPHKSGEPRRRALKQRQQYELY